MEVGSCVGSVMVKYAGKWFDEVPGKVRKSEEGKFEIRWDRTVETERNRHP